MTQNRAAVMLRCSKENACKILKSTVESLPLDITITNSNEEAMQIQLSRPQDIIITEYDLEEGNGIQFLKEITETGRQATRIIVGHKPDEEQIIKAVIKGVASTYIEYTSDSALVQKKLEDILRVRDNLDTEALRDIFPESNEFPINMSVYETLMEAVSNEIPIPDIAKIISKDVTLTAKVLQVANSAFYGNFSGTSIEKAILYMGLNPVKDIVLMHSLVANLKMTTKQNKELEDIVRHSIVTNYYLHSIARKTSACPITALNNSVGIIHDIGKLVQLVFFPLEYRNIDEFREENPGVDYHTCEIETGNKGISHSEIGAYFLRLWNFNQASIESALYHHSPEKASDDMRPCVQALFLANTIADIRDGYNLSLEEAVEKCDMLNITAEDILSIAPPL